MVETAKLNLPLRRYNKSLKPYWTKMLTELSQNQKTAWHQWVDQGRPRDETNIAWQNYKRAKKQFRASQREAESSYRRRCIDELCQSQTVDQKYFWYLVNNTRKSRTNVSATRDEYNGDILYDLDLVKNSWLRYFQSLYTPDDCARYDDNHKANIDQCITRLLSEHNDDCLVVFSVDDVTNMCMSLKKNKAAGWDEVTAEHLIYGGNMLYSILTIIFNQLSYTHNVPDHFKRAVIVPIPKGKDKDLLSKDNYRGISLLSVVSKLYEKLLLQWFDCNSAIQINPLQGACVAHTSCLNSALLLRECVGNIRGNGDTAYVCLLDARKAFDTVWHQGIFFKLAALGCNMHIWHTLWNYYQGFKCSVHTVGGLSEWFEAKQGVHQGGPFSMKLYIIFNNDLLDQLDRSGHGVQCSSPPLNFSCPAYADDVSMVTLYKPKLQALLDISYQHSCIWRYAFNPKKSQVLIFGNDSSPCRQLHLGGEALAVVSRAKHLGTPLATNTKCLGIMIRGKY